MRYMQDICDPQSALIRCGDPSHFVELGRSRAVPGFLGDGEKQSVICPGIVLSCSVVLKLQWLIEKLISSVCHSFMHQRRWICWLVFRLCCCILYQPFCYGNSLNKKIQFAQGLVCCCSWSTGSIEVLYSSSQQDDSLDRKYQTHFHK